MILDFLFTLNTVEAILLLSLFLSCSYQLYKSYFDKIWVDTFNPFNFFALLTLFYCVIGPLVSSVYGDGSIFYRGFDHREYYQIGLLAALISLYAFKYGFEYKNNFLIKDYGTNKKNNFKLNIRNYLFLYRFGERIFIFSMICQFLIYGIGFVNKIRFIGSFDLNAEAPITAGPFGTAFVITINFFIVAILLMFISLLNGVKEKPKFILYLSIAFSTYINYAFRYRIFILFFALALIYYFYKRKKPSITFMLTFILSTFLFFGFVQITRTYGSGLSFEKNKFKNNQGSVIAYILRSSFHDSNAFNTSAGMIYKTPSEYGYVGIAPFLNAAVVPIPRKYWPNKPSGEYMSRLYNQIYGEKRAVGTASLGFAEYYISAGWIGLVFFNFLLGYLYKRLWIWFFYNFYDPIAQISYSAYLSFLFVIYSRGYLLQILYLYITIFVPLILLSYFWNKRFIS